MSLDGDPALALEIHRVEDLRLHLTRLERAGELEQAVGQRRLAVIDVRDDREIADESLVHSGQTIIPHASSPPAAPRASLDHLIEQGDQSPMSVDECWSFLRVTGNNLSVDLLHLLPRP